MMIYLNWGEVMWELFKAGKGNPWGSRRMELIMNSVMIQWIKDN